MTVMTEDFSMLETVRKQRNISHGDLEDLQDGALGDLREIDIHMLGPWRPNAKQNPRLRVCTFF
jgi:hypothetical protein